MTKVLKCSCNHDFQDEKYGKGNRLHNSVTKDKTGREHRCTVCKKVNSTGYVEPKKVEVKK